MSKAFTCDICNRYFSADPQSGAHTTLADGIEQHIPIDICQECTKPLIEFINSQMQAKQAEPEVNQKVDLEEAESE